MPENAGQATQWGVTLAAVIAAAGGLFTAWLNRRSSADTTREQGRQYDINLIITTLQEQVEDLRQTVKDHEVTMQAQRLEIVEMRGSSIQAAARLTEQSVVIVALRSRVAELEGKTAAGGC